MITLDELRKLANDLEELAEQTYPNKFRATENTAELCKQAEAIGLRKACIKMWKFINEHQLKTLS